MPGSSVIPTAGRYTGVAGVRSFFQKVAETSEFDPFVIEQFVEQGDTVVALGSYTGRTLPTRQPFQTRWTMVFQLRNGKVTRFEEFLDTGALEAAYKSGQAARG